MSELPLPEWAPFESHRPFDDLDVRITLARDVAQAPDESLPIITADHYCFSIPEVGYYRVQSGKEIEVALVAGAEMREVRLFLLGSAWAALCYQRGLFPLHASVVQLGSEAVAFCGASGAGKSTIAAWLAQRSYPLVSDDLCRLELPAEGRPRAWPAPAQLRLWSDALGALGWSTTGLERDHFRIDKFHLPWTEARTAQPVPLRAIYLVEAGEIGISRMTGMGGLRRTVASVTYRGELLEAMGQAAAHWRRCTELLRRVPVWEFRRPRGWSAMEAAMDRLIQHWQEEAYLKSSEML